MPILLDHLEDMDNLKEKIENESEEILKIINLKHFLGLNNEEQVEYLTGLIKHLNEVTKNELHLI